MMQLFPGGIRWIPLPFEPYRFDAKRSEIPNIGLIAFESTFRNWNNVCRMIKNKIDAKTIVCMQIENDAGLKSDKKTGGEGVCAKGDILLLACFTDNMARGEAISKTLDPNIPFTVLPILEKTNAYHVFALYDLPMFSEDSSIQLIMTAFNFNPAQRNKTWFLYMGKTDPPLEMYNGSATIVIQATTLKFKDVYVINNRVRAQGPYYLFCPSCKLLNEHESSTCPRGRKQSTKAEDLHSKENNK